MSKPTQTLVNKLEARLEALTQTNLQLQNRVAQTIAELDAKNLLFDVSQLFSKASRFQDVYNALAKIVVRAGADQCTLYICEELDNNNIPLYGQIVFASASTTDDDNLNQRFFLEKHPILYETVRSQETLIIENIKQDERLTNERDFLLQFEAHSVAIIPLLPRSHVLGLLAIEYQHQHTFTNYELDLYRTLSNQTITAVEHIRQIKRTEEALAETQTLYRAGRVLAGAADLQDILQEALVEFVYSLGLDQGGITLLTPDRQFGQLMAYLEDGQLRDIEKLRFLIDDNIPYQRILLSGQPFISNDVVNDARLADFESFNTQRNTTALLQAPIITQGETVGWIGADAVEVPREFAQRETDLARAMADQIAIAIQNHRLLEHTERRARQFKAVATVGEAVTGLMDLDETLNSTVNLIRDQFNFYHVSIFLLDDTREWAVVRASTGKVGKIMVERPHRLGVGSNSLVGFATSKAEARIALDVGQDAVYFDNPLLPKTRSEMALPLIVRSQVIGALDVQSVEANAFTTEDVETLQIMTGQLVAAIENARLFEQTQRRLLEQAMLYSIGTKIGGTLNLQETTDILVSETSEALHVAECALALLEEDDVVYIISDFVNKKSSFTSNQGQRYKTNDFVSWPKILKTKQEFVIHLEDPHHDQGWEFDYLHKRQGTTLAIVPILLRNDVIGVLTVYDNVPGRRFSQEDIALLDSIALQAANAIENARLFEQTQKTLRRTQTLYHISDALTTAEPASEKTVGQQAIFETVLGQYLALLNLDQGSVMLYEARHNHNKVYALFINNQPVEPDLIFSSDKDLIFQHLLANPEPLVIDDVQTHSLTKDNQDIRSISVEAMLFIPLIIRGKVMGAMVADSTVKGHIFSQNDIAIGQIIADQLTIWLENRQLLEEAQYRSSLLQTAAQVSQAASSILDVDELIAASVNLIRDHFNFYYVGMFLVDKARRWAVLRAGTGEAGRIQLDRHHRLEIGGESMIGWSVANRQARIALDVGEEAVRFVNPILPDTHSEMALPLISRDEVIGALTVQSVEQGAFSDEDITLLQTMADQLANAIENASLFTQTQEALTEAEVLYHITQQLSSARDEATIYDLAVEAIASSGIDSGAIYMYVEDTAENGPKSKEQLVEQKAVWTITGQPSVANGTRFRAADFIIEQLVPHQGTILIEDVDEAKLTKKLRKALTGLGITSMLALPLSSHQKRLGFLLTAYKNKTKSFNQNQIRFFTTVAQQTVIALENLRLLEDSQRRARREEIIREITSKIRTAIDLDDILKTTVTELSKVVGTPRGNITLGLTTAHQIPSLESNGSHHSPTGPDNATKTNQVAANKE